MNEANKIFQACNKIMLRAAEILQLLHYIDIHDLDSLFVNIQSKYEHIMNKLKTGISIDSFIQLVDDFNVAINDFTDRALYIIDSKGLR